MGKISAIKGQNSRFFIQLYGKVNRIGQGVGLDSRRTTRKTFRVPLKLWHQSIVFLKAPGLFPVTSLKVVAKYWELLNPVLKAA